MESESPSKETLILFARAPGSGPLRTRLARDVGELEAERLSAAFLADQTALAMEWRERALPGVVRQVALYVPDSVDDALLVEAAARCGARMVIQSGTEPAVQMSRALMDELDRGAQRAFLLGGYTPTLPVHLVEEGLRAVLFHDVVVGPTVDCGVWGVGMQRAADASGTQEASLMEALFTRLNWGTPGLLSDLMERLNRAGVDFHLLPYWPDVIGLDDLAGLNARLRYLELRRSTHGSATRAALAAHPPTRASANSPARGQKRP